MEWDLDVRLNGQTLWQALSGAARCLIVRRVGEENACKKARRHETIAASETAGVSARRRRGGSMGSQVCFADMHAKAGDSILAKFERLIEIVSLDASDRNDARQRWRYYGQLGYQIIRHDVQVTGG